MDRKAALEVNKTRRVRPVGAVDWFQVGELVLNHFRFLGRVEWEAEVTIEDVIREREHWKKIAQNVGANPAVKLLRAERDDFKERIDRCIDVMGPHKTHQWVRYVMGILLKQDDWENI